MDLKRHIDQMMNEQNNRSIPEFEEYSSFEMHNILHFAFEYNNPLSLQKLIDTEGRANFETPEKHSNSCYSLRTFDRFLEYFGLIEIERVGEKWNPDNYITKKNLFNKLIKVRQHST